MTTYLYDHEGSRVKYTKGTTITYYPNKYYNIDAVNKKIKSIYAGDMLVATIETVGTTVTPYYVHIDHLNSTTNASSSTGASVETLDYFPYGNQRISSGTHTEKRQYIGQIYDADTALDYLNARYYKANIGRFISEDPEFWTTSSIYLIDPQSQNSYSYARDNPITLSDPTGKSVYAVAKAIEANASGTHVFLLIVPDNPVDFGVSTGAGWTLGGYAGEQGNLIKAQNAPSDVSVVQNGYSVPEQKLGALKSQVQVAAPANTSDTQFIKNIAAQYNSYNNDAAYDAFASKGYNSNNFATTLLQNSGVSKLPWNGNAPGVDPGYGRAIPANYKKADGTMKSTGLSAIVGYGIRETGRTIGNSVTTVVKAVGNGVKKFINQATSR